MHGLTVRRWKRYGHDRLYVADAGDVRVGCLDLLTGALHLERLGLAAEFDAALREYFGVTGPVVPGATTHDEPSTDGRVMAATDAPAPSVAPLPVPAQAAPPAPARLPAPGPVPAAPTWSDLSDNRPGQQAREQAQTLRAEAPVRTVLARVLGVHTEERAWRIGADGEEKVAAQLEKLERRDGRWCHLNAIPIGDRGSDIDHLVIGPGGVFTLNAKHHPGKKIWVGGDTLLVDGHRVPYVRNSRHEAERAGRLLSSAAGQPVHVQGLVVPVGADDFVVKAQPRDVHVVNRRRLRPWLSELPGVLGADAVRLLFEVARRSTTWSG